MCFNFSSVGLYFFSILGSLKEYRSVEQMMKTKIVTELLIELLKRIIVVIRADPYKCLQTPGIFCLQLKRGKIKRYNHCDYSLINQTNISFKKHFNL